MELDHPATVAIRLKESAEQLLNAHVVLVDTYQVLIAADGKNVWKGAVSKFITETGTVAFAWATEPDAGQEHRYITVLKTPPTTDAFTAVQEWLASQNPT